MDTGIAINNLLAEYCERFDAGDFAAFGALFEHGRWFMIKADDPSPEPVRRWCEQNILLYEGVPQTKHVTTNVRIELADEGESARVYSYVTIWQGLGDFPLQVIFSGRYQDRLECVAGEWRFAERLAVPDVIGDMSRHMREPLPPGPLRRRVE